MMTFSTHRRRFTAGLLAFAIVLESVGVDASPFPMSRMPAREIPHSLSCVPPPSWAARMPWLFRRTADQGRQVSVAAPASPPYFGPEVEDVPLMSTRDRAIFAAFAAGLLVTSVTLTVYIMFSPLMASGRLAVLIFVGYFVVFGGIRTAGNYWLYARSSVKPKPVQPPPPGTYRVAMAATFVSGKEPLAMLEKTIRGMLAVEYPHDSYVLDDGETGEARALVERLDAEARESGRRVYYFSRADKTIKEKGANITAWLEQQGYERYDVATFLDGDFCPRPEYLNRVLGYFGMQRRGRQVAFVQAPSAYFNRMSRGGNVISEGAEQMRQGLFGVALPTYYGQDTPLIIGDHVTIDLRALKKIGGYQVHQSDDLLTAKKLVARGYAGIYTPDPLIAYGIGPASWKEHFIQQTKWAFGVVDLHMQQYTNPVRGLGWRQHMMWIVNVLGYYFMLESMVQSLVLLSFLIIAPRNMPLGWTLLLLAAPVSALRWGMGVWIQKFNPEFANEGRTYWRYALRLVSFSAWPHVLHGIWLALRRKDLPRVVTPKTGNGRFAWYWFRWHAVMAAAITVGEIMSFRRTDGPALLFVQLLGMFAVVFSLFPIVHGLWMHARQHGLLKEARAALTPHRLALAGVLLAAAVARGWGLDYNGAFIDESYWPLIHEVRRALYIIVGDLNLYPRIAPWLHQAGGLLGARAITAVIGFLTTVLIYPLAKGFARAMTWRPAEAGVIALIATAVFAFSEPALATSTLATYHAPAFFLFTLGMTLLMKGIEKQKTLLMVGAALSLATAAAMRYMLIGYLPIAVLFAMGASALRPRDEPSGRRMMRAFLLPLMVIAGVYAVGNHAHLAAGLETATGFNKEQFFSGTLITLIKLSLHKISPAIVLGGFGVYQLYRQSDRGRRPVALQVYGTVLVLGAMFAFLYHANAGHFLQMDQNYVLAMIFASVLAGVGFYEAGRHFPQWRKSRSLQILSLTLLTALLWGQAQIALRNFRQWPDWRPVVSAAQQLPPKGAVWSTANTQTPGNVWELRSALGPRVSVESPWSAPDAEGILRLAAEEGIPYVIGPYPMASLHVGSERYGFKVTRVIPVQNGFPAYIFENGSPRYTEPAYESSWTDGRFFLVRRYGPFDLSQMAAVRIQIPTPPEEEWVQFRFVAKDEHTGSNRGLVQQPVPISKNGEAVVQLADVPLSKGDLKSVDEIQVISGALELTSQSPDLHVRYYRLEALPAGGGSPLVLAEAPVGTASAVRQEAVAPLPEPTPSPDVERLSKLEPGLQKAWSAYQKKDWPAALAFVTQMRADCPSCWERARQLDETLATSSNPWPRLFQQSLGDIYTRYGVLYHVAAAEYIRLSAARALGNGVEAQRAMAALVSEFPHAQVYDPRHFFWSPVLAVVREAPALFIDTVSQQIPAGHPLAWAYRGLSLEAKGRVLYLAIREKVAVFFVFMAAMALLGRRFRRGLHDGINRPGALTASSMGLALIAVSPTALQLAEQILMGHPLVGMMGPLIQLGIGVLFLMNLAMFLLSGPWLLLQRHAAVPSPLRRDDPDLPVVTVQIPARHEPLALVRRAVESALALDYPSDRLEIQVIDNSDRAESIQELEQLSAEIGIQFIHRQGTNGFKARNLNVGMAQSRGSVYLILDSDSTVERAALLKGLAYFRENPQLGYVQFRMMCLNANVNWMTRIQSLGLDVYQRLHRMLAVQGFVRFDGHNGLVLRSALDAIGGWPEVVSEDLAASIAMRLRGYEGRFLYEVESGEEAPETYDQFLRQRRKWAFGTATIVIRRLGDILRSSDMRLPEKASLLNQMLGEYLLSALAFVLSFTYLQFSPVQTVLILLLPNLPFWAVFWRQPGVAVRTFLPSIGLFGSSLPTTFLGVASAVAGRRLGFQITLKQVESTRLPLGTLLRLHAFTFLSTAAFFAIMPFVVPDTLAYLKSVQPSVITMLSAALVPLIDNYWPRKPRSGNPTPPGGHPGIAA